MFTYKWSMAKPTLLLLLRGDAFRQGRSKAVHDSDQPMQLETFASACTHIIAPAEAQGFNVTVVLDVCVATDQQEADIRSSASNAFGSRVQSIDVWRSRCRTQRDSLISIFERQKRRMEHHDINVVTRCDFMWLRSPLPKTLSVKDNRILFLCRIPKKSRLVNDSIYIVPKSRVDAYVRFHTEHYGISLHSMDEMIPNVGFVTLGLFGCNTERYVNPYYFIVGRPRATTNPPTEEAAVKSKVPLRRHSASATPTRTTDPT